MSRELTLGASLAYSDSDGTEASLTLAQIFANVTTKALQQFKLSVPITEIAVPLPDNPGSLGWLILVNRDATNFVNVRVGTGAAIFAQLLAGEFCILRLGSGAQAPYLIADTAPCNVEGIVVAT